MEQQNESRKEREIVPLERARFLDRLAPEYEQQWEDLLKSAGEIRMNLIEFAIPLWQDETFPAAIRDRALLLVIGKEPIGEWNGSWGRNALVIFGGGFRLSHIEGKTSEFKTWLDEALSYRNVIDDRTLFQLSYELFTNEDWDQERFEQTLDTFDPQAVSPTSHDEYPLDPKRFPYLDDIIHGVTAAKTNTKLQDWAYKKLTSYIRNTDSTEETLNAGVKKLLKTIYYRLDTEQEFPDTLTAGIEAYGFDCIESPFEGQELFDHLGKMPPHLVVAYAKWRFKNYLEGRGALYEISREYIMNQIHEPVPESLLALSLKVIDYQKKQAEIERQRDEKRHRDYEIRQATDPVEIAKKESEIRYRNLLDTIRNADRFNS